MGKITQEQVILKHLIKFGNISTLESYDLYKITDLQHAIMLLRKRNFPITDRWEHSKTNSGWSNKYKRYFLGGQNEITES